MFDIATQILCQLEWIFNSMIHLFICLPLRIDFSQAFTLYLAF